MQEKRTDDNPIKVSVIVPAYNVDKCLERCLLSLVSQTLKPIEIIVVNDGSTDLTGEIGKKAQDRWPDKVCYLEKKNEGVSRARNYGIQHASGEYLGFVDGDDYVEPAFLEKMYGRGIAEEAQIVCCGYKEIFPNREVTYHCNPARFNQSVIESPRILDDAQCFSWNKIYKRDFWLKHGFAFPEGQWFEDSALIYRVMLMANKVSAVDEPLYFYERINVNSLTRKVNRHVFDVFMSMQSMIDSFKEYGADEKLHEELEFLCLRHITARYKPLSQSGEKKIAREYVNRAFDFLDKHFPDWRSNRFMRPEGEQLMKRMKKWIERNKVLLLMAVSI